MIMNLTTNTPSKLLPGCFLLGIIVLLGIQSCKKEEEIPPNPVIEFISASETDVISFENTITLTIAYDDQQGDIGEMDPDKKTIQVKDSRLDDADWYHIPPITPDGMQLHTQGQFDIVLPALFLLGNGSEETTSFNIQLQDQAGNWSNTITSPTITIHEE